MSVTQVISYPSIFLEVKTWGVKIPWLKQLLIECLLCVYFVSSYHMLFIAGCMYQKSLVYI